MFCFFLPSNAHKAIVASLSLSTPPPPQQSAVKRLCAEANRSWSRSRLIDGLFGLQRRGIVIRLWDEVRGHGPSVLKQKADHKTRPIIMHCCRAPAGTMLSISPSAHDEPLDLSVLNLVKHMIVAASVDPHG